MTPLTGTTRTTALLGMATLALCLAVPGSVSAGNYTAQPAAKLADDKAAKPAAPYTAITPPGYTAKTVQPVVPRSTTAARTQTDVELEKINKQYEKDLRDALKSQLGNKNKNGLQTFGLFGMDDILGMLNGDNSKGFLDSAKKWYQKNRSREKEAKAEDEAGSKKVASLMEQARGLNNTESSQNDGERKKIFDQLKGAVKARLPKI